jgi:hypothetical protein
MFKNQCNPSHLEISRLLTSSLSLGVPVPQTTQCIRVDLDRRVYWNNITREGVGPSFFYPSVLLTKIYVVFFKKYKEPYRKPVSRFII